MGFNRKERSKVVDQASTRLSAMKQIDTQQGAAVNYGSATKPLTSAIVETQITLVELKRTQYNQFLEQADAKNNEFEAEEQKLEFMHSGVLKGAVPQFGEDSNEVEMLGGTRVSERKPRTHKPKPSS